MLRSSGLRVPEGIPAFNILGNNQRSAGNDNNNHRNTEFQCNIQCFSAFWRAFTILNSIASKLKGDTGGDFLTAVELDKAYQDIQAVALVCASWWYLDNLGKLPERLVTEMRIFERRPDISYIIIPFLGLFSEILNRNGYKDMIPARVAGTVDNDSLKDFYQLCRRKYESPVIDAVPEKPFTPFQLTTTVKRSVPKTGRNEPCHCGSGKKYKH